MSNKKGTGKSAHYDVIIVGGGPAGLFAAYYLSQHSDYRVLLIEKGKVPGSAIVRSIPIRNASSANPVIFSAVSAAPGCSQTVN